MSTHPSGTCKKSLFSRQDYLAPLPLPTGQKPSDCMGVIWRKNDAFIDISNYNIGSGVMMLWPLVMLFSSVAYALNDIGILVLGAVITGLPSLMLIYALWRPTPLPIRFNRQRREACFLKKNGEYWIVPWESVVAAATQVSSTSQGGKITHGMLFISLENPDPNATKDNQHFTMGFGCGGGETAMALWECVRTYMEVGPDAITDYSLRFGRAKGIWASYLNDLMDAAKRKGWFMTLLWDGFFGLFIFNTLLADQLERWKLYPLPDLDHPDIIEWSKPLPREQWASPSPELQAALANMGVKPEARA